MEAIIEILKKEVRNNWFGDVGERHAVKLENFLREMLADYSTNLRLPPEHILAVLEKRRTYNAVNFYQEANMPNLKNVRVFETQDDFKKAFPSMRFRCPFCNGITSNPYECNSGVKKVGRGGDKACDWKTYGLFRTLGKGFRFTIKKGFLEKPFIDEIFMPLELESNAEAKTKPEILWYERDASFFKSEPKNRKPTKLHINCNGLSLCGRIMLITEKDIPNPMPNRKCKSCLQKSSQKGFSIKKAESELATA